MTDYKMEARRKAKSAARLVKRGGCTPEQKQDLIDSQNGKCAICEREGMRLGVDHCHETDTIRAALCHNCNVALGHAKDNPERLRKMADYIETHRDYRWEYYKIYGCKFTPEDVQFDGKFADLEAWRP